MGTPLKAFISYKWESQEVADWVKKFAKDLRQNGVEALLDEFEVPIGGSFTQYMGTNIPSADVFLFVVTPRSVESIESTGAEGGMVKFEVEMARAHESAGSKQRFVPVLLKGEAPNHLGGVRYIDFRDESAYESKFAALLDVLKGKQSRPPLLGAGTLRYDARVYEMLPAVEGSPVRKIMARFEPYVGFPFYSFESDHPTRWPKRVYEDRKPHTQRILAFMTNPDFAQSIDRVLGESDSSITTYSDRTKRTDEQRETKAVELYSKLRMIGNSTSPEEVARFRESVGEKVYEGFQDLEREWKIMEEEMPNRVLTLGLAHDRDVALQDVNVSMEIVGDIYDLMLDNEQPLSPDQTEDIGVGRKFTIKLGEIPPGATKVLRLWYNYIPVESRWDPKPIHLKAEPTQGVLLHSLGALGVTVKNVKDIIEDEGVYHEFDLDLVVQ